MTGSERRTGAGWGRGIIRIAGPALILLSMIILIVVFSVSYYNYSVDESAGDADHLNAFPAALAIAGLLVCAVFLPAGAYRRVLVGLGTGLAAATAAAFAVSYAMYANGSCFADSSYKTVDCFVDSHFSELRRNIGLAAAPAFVLFFPLGYRAAGQDGVTDQEDT